MPAIRLTVDSIQPLASLKGILASGVRSAALDVNAARYLFFGTVYPDVLGASRLVRLAFRFVSYGVTGLACQRCTVPYLRTQKLIRMPQS